MDVASLVLSWAIVAQVSGTPAGVPQRLGPSQSKLPGAPASGAKQRFGDAKPTPSPSPFGQRDSTAPMNDSSSRLPFPPGGGPAPAGSGGGFPMDRSGGQGKDNTGRDNPLRDATRAPDIQSGAASGANRGVLTQPAAPSGGRFVTPLRDELPFAPGTQSGSLEPTPAAPPKRYELSPEPPISGPLAPVRHEEPGKLAKSVLAEAINPPPGESLTGQTIPLFDALARSAGRVPRAETTKAYWAAATAMADYYVWLDTRQRIVQLGEGARHASVELAAAAASAQAQLREAELVAAETRHRLATFLGDPQIEPMCADAPHVGGYRTEFERLFANRPPPPQLHLIHRTLPLRQRAIELRAEAVRSAREALDAMTTALARGQAEARDVLLQLDLYRAARQGFVHEVEQYNGQIADYAVGIAGEGGDLNHFVPLLIRSATPSSILTPRPQQGGTLPTAVPPGSVLPPAGSTAAGGERSILRSRTRLADAQRDENVRPALAEEPIVERTFVGDSPAKVEPLQKVDPWAEPQLQPVDAKPTDANTQDAKQRGAKPGDAKPASAPAAGAKAASSSSSSVTINAAPNKKAPGTGGTGAAPAQDAGPAKEVVPKKKPKANDGQSSPSAAGSQSVKHVAFRPLTADATSLADVASMPPQQWAAALAERLHETPANPLDNHVVPTPLRECLRQTTTAADRRAAIGAFWVARERAARYQAAVMRGRQIDALRVAGRTGNEERSLGSLIYSAMRAAAEADEVTARLELSVACYELTVTARQPPSGAWLWPGTRPPAERLVLPPAPQPAQPVSAVAAQAALARRHLETIITGSYALVSERAAAVIKADAARQDAASRADRSLVAPYQWIERQHDETLRFLGALTRYHLAYADYTLSDTPEGTPPEALTRRLLASETARR